MIQEQQGEEIGFNAWEEGVKILLGKSVGVVNSAMNMLTIPSRKRDHNEDIQWAKEKCSEMLEVLKTLDSLYNG